MTRIIIIEDDRTISEMYRFKLQQKGYDVIVVDNGADGLKQIADSKPDLILLDLMIPIMTGSEMLSKLRAKAWGKDIPVVILSNVSQDEAQIDLQKLHVVRYLVKAQYTPTQLAVLVNEILDDSNKTK
jgi:DNA-binding response OmpR family regulator